MEPSIADITRLIIGEVLNENCIGIQDLIHEYIFTKKLLTINVIGYCGESPAHIAIYKNHTEMLTILIQAGANPNYKNQQGETLIHTASKLGRLHLLQLLYETGQANLEIQDDRFHGTALEILQQQSLSPSFNIEEIIIASRLYANWSSEEEEKIEEGGEGGGGGGDGRGRGKGREQQEIEMIIEGRKQCEQYLKEKLEYDRQMKIIHLTKDATDWTLERERKRRILIGLDHEDTIYYHGPYLSFPEKEGVCQFNEYDQRFFNRYRKGIHSLATEAFSQQIYLNAMKIGSLKAEKAILRERENSFR